MKQVSRVVKNCLAILLFTFPFFLSPLPSHAQIRYAECDACGYCIGKSVPESWESCKKCLYPATVGVATDNKTLEIITAPIQDPNNPNKVLINVPVPPAKGKYYTQLGCVDTALSSFSDPGAVGGVLNFLLSKLIFPVTGTLAFLFLLYGAFLLITAQGSEEQISRGKRYITGSIVGIVFTFSSVLIINIVGGDILRIPGLNRSTKVTYIGYGTPTSEVGILTYPRVSVQYDGKEIDTIKSLQGSASSQQEYTFYLPGIIDITNQADVNKVTFLFDNDKCIDCNPHDAVHFGDRNIFNTRILFDGKPCRQRTLLNESNPIYRGPFNDGGVLGNYWPNKPIQCSLKP